MKRLAMVAAVVAIATSSLSAQAKVETVLEGLNNPCGVAIQPTTGHVFVSDSGAGRVVRVVDGKPQDVITDFPIDTYGKGPKFNIGPLGLAFLGQDTLVVGGGGFKDGEELLRVYKIPKAGAAAIKADAMVASFKLAATDDVKGEGNFYGLVASKGAVYVTANGDDTKGWVGRASVTGTKVGDFKRFLATKEATEVDAPVGITISPQGYIVVGQMGEISIPGDGLLTFYDAKSGKMLANFEVGLSDITSLAYSPKTGQLYAADFAWPGKENGGIYHLVAKDNNGKQEVQAKKVTALARPSCIAFSDDGTLYITQVGEKDDDDGEGAKAKKTGRLVKISGL